MIDLEAMTKELLNSISFTNPEQNHRIVKRYLKQAYELGDHFKWCDDLDDILERLNQNGGTGSL